MNNANVYPQPAYEPARNHGSPQPQRRPESSQEFAQPLPPAHIPAGPQPQPGFQPWTGSGAPLAPPYKQPYVFEKGDAAFAGVLLALGFLFWEWVAPKYVEGAYDYAAPGLGVSLFLFALCGVTLVYLYRKGIRQTRASLAWLAATVAGALPFLLYPALSIFLWLAVFEAATFMVWLSVSCGTSVSKKLSGFVFFDGVNQLFVVAFSNFAALFAGLRKNSQGKERSKRFMIGLLGVVICIPVIAAVIVLLMRADTGFANLMQQIAEALRLENLWHYAWEILLGIPVACYLYGALYGNAHRRRTDEIKEAEISASIAGAHRIPRVALTAPMAVFCILYVLFFIAMGSYLFSAFFGHLPAGYNYAEYARRGFFELCGVAAINLAFLAFVWWFARRGAGERPRRLCFFGGVLSGLTILLIVTAMSKMLLYVGEYGLTRLRVYTVWFMILLLVVFAFLLIWHLRPFNAGKPIVLAVTGLVLALFLTNTDGLIAKYNTENYLNGRLAQVDLVMLANLNDARIPDMERLAAEAPDLYGGSYGYLPEFTIYGFPPEAARKVPYMGRNLVSAAALERHTRELFVQ